MELVVQDIGKMTKEFNGFPNKKIRMFLINQMNQIKK